MNDFYTDKQLEKLFGKRRTDGIILFDASELGWLCPVKKKHAVCWSEFNKHIWCYDCKKDYFTLLCPKGMNPATTKNILAQEKRQMRPLQAAWTLEKYKKLGKAIRKKGK